MENKEKKDTVVQPNIVNTTNALKNIVQPQEENTLNPLSPETINSADESIKDIKNAASKTLKAVSDPKAAIVGALPKIKINGGRILHTRKRTLIA
jgi:hypothetical protein